MASSEIVSNSKASITEQERDSKQKKDAYLESRKVLRSALEECDERSITVQNLPPDMKEESLRSQYASYDPIDSITVVQQKGNMYAHVCFSTADVAMSVSAECRNTIPMDNAIAQNMTQL